MILRSGAKVARERIIFGRANWRFSLGAYQYYTQAQLVLPESNMGRLKRESTRAFPWLNPFYIRTSIQTTGVAVCSRSKTPARDRIAGLGLTGIITSAAIKLRKVAGPVLESEDQRFTCGYEPRCNGTFTAILKEISYDLCVLTGDYRGPRC
jgi:hypothetical protein